MKLVIFGLSITSSWGNRHATIYRSLVRELARLGHRVTFFERDTPWFTAYRDLPHPPYCRTILYSSLEQCFGYHGGEIGIADWVMVGSHVPDGIKIGERVTRRGSVPAAFYDLDTPVTLAKLAAGSCSYLRPSLVSRYKLYLSCAGGAPLGEIKYRFGANAAFPLYCCVDPELHYPEAGLSPVWDLGYLGTYSPDRQPQLERLLCLPAARWDEGRFVVAGPQYPVTLSWSCNTKRIDHVPPEYHRSFYGSQRFTLNLTRSEMTKTGYAPGVRLFESAACAVPVISDRWKGIEEFFVPGEEILLAADTEDVLRYLREFPEQERLALGERARAKVLAAHTAAHRAQELVGFLNLAGR